VEGGPFHDRVDWDGRGDFENQLVFRTGSLPTFVPEKGPKATFPCQGKVQKLYFGLIQVIQEVK
tara:strand:+ start:119 stop:310 length:192 start_codon:yes stop_codon:yes gene_type:complete